MHMFQSDVGGYIEPTSEKAYSHKKQLHVI